MSARSIAFAILASWLLLPDHCYGWWSAPPASSNHGVLAKDAVDLTGDLAGDQYALDLQAACAYGNAGMWRWMSGPGNDESAHGKDDLHPDAGMYNGGPIDRWWGVDAEYPTEGVLPQYRRFNFDVYNWSAYYYLALMGHLVADQAVPAHAANISHLRPLWELVSDPTYGDDFERQANSSVPLQYRRGIHVIGDKDPRSYYRDPFGFKGSLDATKRNLPSWRYSGTGENYWVLPPGHNYRGAAYDPTWGHYGFLVGPNPANPLDYADYYYKAFDDQDIIEQQFTQAISYTAGMLVTASKALPPLVRNLRIAGAPFDAAPEIDLVDGTTISFTVMENRTPSVSVTIEVRNTATGKQSILVLDSAVWDKRKVQLARRGSMDGDHLPWEKVVTLEGWKGQSSDGLLPHGDYELKISVTDEDDNEVNATFPDINDDGENLRENDTQRNFRIKPELHLALIIEDATGSTLEGVVDGAVFDRRITTTYDLRTTSSGVKDFVAQFGEDPEDDCVSHPPEPGTRQEACGHFYRQQCSTVNHHTVGGAVDLQGNTADAHLFFSITGAKCPPCFTCLDTAWGTECRLPPDSSCNPPVWRASPDDNVDLATSPPVVIAGLPSHDPSSPIGVLRSGYYAEMFKLLNTFGARAALVGIGFDPSIVRQIRVLVIPTGGLAGMETSDLFKAALAEYAHRGGVIVSLAQEHGREFAALPGEPAGYGWLEDTACFTKAFYIEQYGQFLSGQHIVQGTSDAEVDGYFTELPAEAAVYLRRTRNGQPGLVVYPHGAGQVIATTAYTDWAHANGQAAMDARHLVRDVLAWALDPKELPEFRPGAVVDLPVEVMNFGLGAAANQQGTSAEKVRFTVFTPDRKIFTERVVDAHVELNTLREVSLGDLALPAESVETVGIWWVDYTLLDASGTIVQEPVRANRFVVSPASVSPYQQRDFYFSIQSDSDFYPVGGRAEFTFIAYNHTDAAQLITVNGHWPWFIETMTVPAHGHHELRRAVDPLGWRNGLYDGGGVAQAFFTLPDGKQFQVLKQFRVYTPAVGLALATDKAVYGTRGETALIDLTMTNLAPAPAHSEVSLEVWAPDGTVALTRRFPLDWAAGASLTESIPYTFPEDAAWGTYTVLATAIDALGNNVNAARKSFVLSRAMLAVVPRYPVAFAHTNDVAFDLSNIGSFEIAQARIVAELTAPDGTSAWRGAASAAALAPGETRTLGLTVSVPEIRLGTYALHYEVTFDGKKVEGERAIVSAVGAAIALDRAEYRLNETMGVLLNLSNTGDFRQEVSASTRIADLGFEAADTVIIEPGAHRIIALQPVVSSTLACGRHQVTAEARVPSGDTVGDSRVFVVKPPAVGLEILLPSPRSDSFHQIRALLAPTVTLAAGDAFVGEIQVRCRLEIADAAYVDTTDLTLRAGQIIRLSAADATFPRVLSVPEDMTAGNHQVLLTLTFPNGFVLTKTADLTIADSRLVISSAGDTFSAGDTIVIDVRNVGGVDADYATQYLELRDRDWNLIVEETASGTLLVGERRVLAELHVPQDAAAGDGYLSLAVSDGHQRSYYLSKAIRIDGVSAGLRIATDQAVYAREEPVTGIADVAVDSREVADATLKLTVQRYNDGGARDFLRFLPKGGYWNFGEPGGITVDRQGAVYVTNGWHDRIQKLDASGTLLRQWGTHGRGDAQFDWPMATAVGPDGSFYVADSGNGRIQKFAANGRFVSTWGSTGSGIGQFDWPRGIAAAPDGTVYVSDTYNHRIQKFDASGNFLGAWGVTYEFVGSARTEEIAVDLNGYVYVTADYGIAKYDADGNRVRWMGSGLFLSDLTSVAVDANGFVHAAEWNGDTIHRFDPDGNYLGQQGVAGTGEGELSGIYSLAASPGGRLFTADTWYRVQQFTLDMTHVETWSTYGNAPGRFGYASPQDVSVASWGDVYAVDTGNSRIEVFSSEGELIGEWEGNGPDHPQFGRPESLHVTSYGQVYVADTGGNRIQFFWPDGRFIFAWGSTGAGDGQFSGPTGVVRAPNGTIYVVDSRNHRVQQFDFYGGFIRKWGSLGSGNGQFSYPQRIAVDADGNVYVTDGGNHRVQKFTEDGAFLASWGTLGTGEGQFETPCGIAVHPDGTIYVVDSSVSRNRHFEARNNRIQQFDADGNFLKSWGGAVGDAGAWDSRGTAGDASGLFSRPRGIAITGEGIVYVADSGNQRVQRLSPQPGYESIKETSQPLDQAAGSSRRYETALGLFDPPGSMKLIATLQNARGERIASAEHQFAVTDHEIAVVFSTVAKFYRPGEAIQVSGEIRNNSSLPISGVTLLLTRGDLSLLTEVFDVGPESAAPFSVTDTAGEEGTYLLSAIAQRDGVTLSRMSGQYDVALSGVSVGLYAPAEVGSDPFTVEFYASNDGISPVTFTFSSPGLGLDGEWTLAPGESRSVYAERRIAVTTEFVVAVGGEVERTASRIVTSALAAQLEVATETCYAEGAVVTGYQITNVGRTAGTYPAEFTLYEASGRLLSSRRADHYLTLDEGGNSARGTFECQLEAGEYRLHYNTIGAAGDVLLHIVKPSAALTIEAGGPYPDGEILIPYGVRNTGQIPAEFQLLARITKGDEVIVERRTAVFLGSPDGNAVEAAFEGTVVHALVPGSYAIQGFLDGALATESTFLVLPRVAVSLSVTPGANAGGMLPVGLTVVNAGAASFAGSVLVDTGFWSAEEAIGPINPGAEWYRAFPVPLPAAAIGEQPVRVRVLSRDGRVLASTEATFTVRGPGLSISQLPEPATFPTGGNASLRFCVTNGGDQEGYFVSSLTAFEGSQTEPGLLRVGEERCSTFSFPIPADIEEKDYPAVYTLRAIVGGAMIAVDERAVGFHVSGVKVDVHASLDRKLYRAGGVARVALDIRSIGSLAEVPLGVRVNFNDFEEWRYVTLPAQGVLLEFDVPVTSFDGRLLYEVVLESGRSIYINTLYVQEQHDRVWLSTDKPAYLPGETVAITVEAAEAASVEISGLDGGFLRRIDLEPHAPATCSLALPVDLFGGTQFLTYVFGGETQIYRFNVASPRVEFVDLRLDKPRYRDADPFQADLLVRAEAGIDGWVDGFIEDPEGQLTPAFSYEGRFAEGVTSFRVAGEIRSRQTGMHRLFCLFYRDADRSRVITTVAQAFDVGGFSLTQLVADRGRYREGIDPLTVTAHLAGELDGNISVAVDGAVLLVEPLAFRGFDEVELSILPQNLPGPGPHTARVRLFTQTEESVKQLQFEIRKKPAPPSFDVLPALTNREAAGIAGTAGPLAGVSLFINGAAFGTASADAAGRFDFGLVTLPIEGPNTLDAVAFDDEGTRSDTTSAVVEKDVTSPIVAITSPVAGTTGTGAPQLNFSAGGGIAVVKLDGLVVGTHSGESFGPLADGNHVVRVESTDAAGNVGSAEVVFTTRSTVPREVVVSLAASGGRALVGVPVYAFSAASVFTGKSAVSDAMGKAVFGAAQFADGTYRFRADYLGYQLWSGPLTLPGEYAANLTVAEESVAISVVQGGVAKGAIRVYPLTAGGTYPGLSGLTDANGVVSFTLPRGRDYLFRADYLGNQYFSPVLTVAPNGSHQLSIDVGGGVMSVAVDRGNGVPIGSVPTRLFTASGSYLGVSRTTDAAGRAAFSVPSGSYKVRVDYLGYQFWSEATRVAGNAGITVSIPHRTTVVAVAGTFAGDRAPKTGVPAHLFTDSGTYLNIEKATDSTGKTTFDLPERGYKVRADYLMRQFWSEVLTGGEAAITIPEAIADVTVTGSSAALAGVPVSVFDKSNVSIQLSKGTDANGRASFRLPAETYRFRATCQGSQFFSASVGLPRDKVVRVPIATEGGSFMLTVQGGAGRALNGLACALFTPEGGNLNVNRTTDGGGQALFNLANGSYRFRVDFLGKQFWTDVVTLPGVGSLTLRIVEEHVVASTLRGGRAQSGVPVSLFTSAGAFLGQSVTTDAEGRGTLALPAGKSYKLRADFLGSRYWSEVVTVAPGGQNEVRIDLGGGALTVRLHDGNGRPLPGVSAHLFSAAGAYLGLSRQTDDAGAAVFDVSGAEYRVRCDLLGYQFWSDLVTVWGDTSLPFAITHRDVLITASGDYDGSIEPRPGLPVHLFTTAGSDLENSAETDANGQVGFSLPDRDYMVRVDNLSFSYWSDPIRGSTSEVTIPEAVAEVTVVRGTVPEPGIPVQAFGPTGVDLGINATTDESGRAAFRLPAERYQFRADHRGDASFSTDTALGAHTVQPVIIQLGGGKTAVLVSDGNAPIPGVSCRLFDEAGRDLGLSSTTGAAGKVHFDLPDGDYRVRADYLGHQFWSGVLTVPDVAGIELIIPRRETGVTVQRTYQEDTRAVAGIPVYLFDESGTYLGERTMSDTDGRASFLLAEIACRIRADYLGAPYWSDALAWTSPVVTIREGVAVVVVTQAGSPLAGIRVEVSSEGGKYLGISELTDADGEARLRLPEGSYRFGAVVQGNRYFGTGAVAANQVTMIALSTGGGRFDLTVDDGKGRSLSGVPVSVFTSSGTAVGLQDKTDAQGRASFLLSDADYVFRVDHLGHQFWTTAHFVPEETSGLITIPHATVTLTVERSLEGVPAPISGAPVLLFSPGGADLGVQVRTNASGSTGFELPVRQFKFRVDHEGQQFWSDLISVEETGTQRVSVGVAP